MSIGEIFPTDLIIILKLVYSNYLKRMTKNTSLFISHTTHDHRDFNLAHKISKGLKSRGIDVWIAPDSIPPGEKWEEQIVSAIMEKCSHFLVILSAAAIKADWVLKEIKLAKTYCEYNDNFSILPLVVGQLENYSGKDFLTKFQNIPYKDDISEQLEEIISAMGLRPVAKSQFEERVAEIYRLLHFNVEYGRKFSEREVKLFLARRLGDITIYRAIDCQLDTIEQSHIDAFALTMRNVTQEYSSVHGTIVTSTSFKPDLDVYAKGQNIQLITYKDLSSQLLDGHKYAHRLRKECLTNERYKLPLYIESFIGHEATDEGITQELFIDEWLNDSEWNQLTLLGDVGTGKSFLCRVIAFRYIEKFLKNPLINPLPILIDLRKAEREFSLEGLILTHFAQNGLAEVTFDVFQHALSNGQILLILDGFDEMAARVTRQVTNRNFHELTRCVKGRAKVLLTCRTHYFKSRTEEEEVVLGIKQNYESEIARDLYWELIARRGYKIAYLMPFNIPQIEQYVRRTKPKTYKQVLHKIRATYNLMELSQRPMLLEMIVKSIDKLEGKQINAATLYRVVTDVWIHRDEWRDVLTPEEKLALLMNLAQRLWLEDALSIHYTTLLEYLKRQFDSQIIDSRELFEIDSEIRTASFLTRDDSGNYGFAHRSHMEFFFARYLADELSKGNFECINTRRISPEIIGFLQDMIDTSKIEQQFEEILCSEYRPMISENALICLYGFRRNKKLSELSSVDQTAKAFTVPLPQNMKLKDAQLEQVTLEGANLEGADLTAANLSEAILNYSNLQKARLSKAVLEKASLSNANLKLVCADETSFIGSNLENADLSGSSLKNADLTDCFLIGIKIQDANLASASFKGAEFSVEYQNFASQYSDVGGINQRLQSSGQSNIDEYWKIIEELRPWMLRVSRLTALQKGEDAEDVVSDIIVSLANQQRIEKLSKMNFEERKAYIYQLIRVNLYRLAYKEGRDDQIPDDFYFKYEIIDEGDFWEVKQETNEDEDEDEYFEEDYYEIDRLGSAISIDDEETTIDFGDLESREWEDKLLEKQLIREIKTFLSEDLWQVVEAKYWYGYNVTEIATQRNSSPVDIQRMLVKARYLLKSYFAK